MVDEIDNKTICFLALLLLAHKEESEIKVRTIDDEFIGKIIHEPKVDQSLVCISKGKDHSYICIDRIVHIIMSHDLPPSLQERMGFRLPPSLKEIFEACRPNSSKEEIDAGVKFLDSLKTK